MNPSLLSAGSHQKCHLLAKIITDRYAKLKRVVAYARAKTMDFCKHDVWVEAISSTQTKIVREEMLFEYASELREAFDADKKAISYQALSENAINAPDAVKIASVRSGYDMPISFGSAADSSSAWVALVFQDPLRGNDAPDTLSLGVPFALADKHMRAKKRYAFIWNLVERLCASGKSVWVTDAKKLWLDPNRINEFSRDEISRLEKLQSEALRRELDVVDPQLTIAFGGQAQRSLDEYAIEHSKHPHPGVYGGKTLIEAYGLKPGNFSYAARLDGAWDRITRELKAL